MVNCRNKNRLMDRSLCLLASLCLALALHSTQLYAAEELASDEAASVVVESEAIVEAESEPLAESEPQEKVQTPEELCLAEAASLELVDRVRSKAHEKMCRTAAWVDGLFGDEHKFDDSNFSGMLSVGFRQDETDGFDPRLRVRVRTKLPNVSSRFNAFVGRVEEDSYISNTEVKQDSINSVGLRSTNDDDAEWLLGLGYANPTSRNNGFDYSIGAKLSHGFNPYAKITHRYLFTTSEDDYWRTKQTAFWRRDEKFGFSSHLDYTKILNDRDIMEWDTSAKYTEDSDQWEWITSTALHHSFSNTRGVSTRLYVRGEEKNPVSIPEYGISFTYIREFLRPWLFVETGVDFRWEKDERNTAYKSATRFAIQLEMLIGDYYGKYRNKRSN